MDLFTLAATCQPEESNPSKCFKLILREGTAILDIVDRKERAVPAP